MAERLQITKGEWIYFIQHEQTKVIQYHDLFIYPQHLPSYLLIHPARIWETITKIGIKGMVIIRASPFASGPDAALSSAQTETLYTLMVDPQIIEDRTPIPTTAHTIYLNLPQILGATRSTTAQLDKAYLPPFRKIVANYTDAAIKDALAEIALNRALPDLWEEGVRTPAAVWSLMTALYHRLKETSNLNKPDRSFIRSIDGLL